MTTKFSRAEQTYIRIGRQGFNEFDGLNGYSLSLSHLDIQSHSWNLLNALTSIVYARLLASAAGLADTVYPQSYPVGA